MDLAVAQHHSCGHRVVTAEAPAGRAGERRHHPAPGFVARPGDRSGGGRHHRHQLVRIGEAESLGHSVLLLQQQDVTWSSRRAVQLHPGPEQHVVGLAQAVAVALQEHHLGLLGPVQRVHVAQAAPTVLQVGLEQERHLAGRAMTLLDDHGEVAEPSARVLAPLPHRLVAQLIGEAVLAGEVAHVEERRRDGEVVTRQTTGLLHGAHRVAQLQPGIPDRVPERLGHGVHAATAVVEQQQIEIAARRQLAPPVPADGYEGDGLIRGLGGDGVEALEPGVGDAGEGSAQRCAREGTVGQQLVTTVERHGAEGTGRSASARDRARR
jgi:hypothetical protein